VQELRATEPNCLLGADLFSGAGGLSLGLKEAGIDVVFSVDHDDEAVATHGHHFPGLSANWDLTDPVKVQQVGELIRRLEIDVVVGGPPCQPFSKAGRSGIRHYVLTGARSAHDHRRDLWQAYLEVVRFSLPKVVIMENVPDMALDREMFIFRTMVHELEELGYSTTARVLETWRYGVPQFRQRLILVGISNGVQFMWPQELERKVTVENAIGDLPPVEGGWRPDGGADGWAEYEGPVSEFQRRMRIGVDPENDHKVFDHITRPVRPDDALAFEQMDSRTRYSELPTELKRYRDDIFDDKYKRLDANDLSRTITAHIAKDGYWYIHPEQNRTITVREAARLQTFPDSFRFAGPPSAAFRQIGNAVPPAIGRALGTSVFESLDAMSRTCHSTTQETSARLGEWFRNLANPSPPWLKADTRWQVIAAQTLLDRASADHIRHIWPLVRRWRYPEETLEARDELLEIGRWINRIPRAQRVLTMAEIIAANHKTLQDQDLEYLSAEKIVPQSTADLAALAVCPETEGASEEPVIVSRSVLRPVARIVGEPVNRRNNRTDGRLALASIIGFGPDSRDAHLALVSIGAGLCHTVDPICTSCPASGFCSDSNQLQEQSNMLPLDI